MRRSLYVNEVKMKDISKKSMLRFTKKAEIYKKNLISPARRSNNGAIFI